LGIKIIQYSLVSFQGPLIQLKKDDECKQNSVEFYSASEMILNALIALEVNSHDL